MQEKYLTIFQTYSSYTSRRQKRIGKEGIFTSQKGTHFIPLPSINVRYIKAKAGKYYGSHSTKQSKEKGRSFLQIHEQRLYGGFAKQSIALYNKPNGQN